MKFDSDKNYYEILGIGQDATREEIDRAFRSEARRRHPDSGGSEEEMKDLNEAHDVLGDEKSRKEYDKARRPERIVYSSSMAFDSDAASKQGTLKIPVSNGDFTGLVMGAAACFGLGLPFLAVIETQWVFFLWPLRLMSIGVLMIGTLMAHSALRVKQRQIREDNPAYHTGKIILQSVVFWILAACVFTAVAVLIYST